MSRVRFAALAAGVVLLAGASPDDRGALQGSWASVSLRVNGQDVPADHFKGGHLVVNGDRVAATFADEPETVYSLATDATANPPTIELTFADGPKKGRSLKGIYRVSGETLTVCRGLTESDPRPTGFDAPSGSNRVLAVWAKAKPAAVAAKAAAAVRPEVARELARFQGAWRMTSAVSDGLDVPDAQVKRVTMTFEGAKHTVRIGDEVVAHDVAFELEPTAEPKAVTDTVPGGSDGKPMVIRGIYKLEGDTLVSCVAAPNQDRPKSFDAPAGTGRSLRTFRREPPPDPAVEAERSKLQGSWSIASMEFDGQPTPSDSLAGSKLVFEGTRFTAEAGGGSVHGTYKLDLNKSPRAIDVTFSDGPDAGRSSHGVYEVDGATVRICLAPAGKPRPLGFTSRPGTGHTFEVLKR